MAIRKLIRLGSLQQVGHGLASQLTTKSARGENLDPLRGESLLDVVCELLESYGFDILDAATTIMLNEAVKVECVH